MVGARTIAIIALFAVAIGIVARLDSLGHKLFWQDEAYAMLRVTGHEQADLDRLFDGRTHAASELIAVDRLDARRGLPATLASLREEPQRGPLFYVTARAWAAALGDGVARMRLLSACVGVAGIGFAFLLGRRIAGGTGGAVLAALVAISPIEVRYSQQVREYEAIAAMTLASAWLLLRAIERRSFVRWASYAVSLIAGLFVSPIFAAVVVAHGVVATIAACRDGRRVYAGWFAAVIVAVAVVAPWFVASLAAASGHANDLAWLRAPYSLKSYAVKWAFNAGAAFFDTEFARVRYGIVLVPILALEAGAVVSACIWPRDPVVRALALATLSCSLVPLVVLDVVQHAHFESVTRYQMTTWIGIDLVVALLVARACAAGGNVARAGVAAFAFLVACGTFSAAFARPYEIWWDDNEHLDERSVGAAIARGAPAPVLATKDGSAEPYALVLSRYLPAATPMLLYGVVVPSLPAAPSRIFVFVPDARVLSELTRRIAPERTMRNVSPAIGLTIPDLRAPRDARTDAAIRADNALWSIGPHTLQP
jgi:uncharacterized membrane protein